MMAYIKPKLVAWFIFIVVFSTPLPWLTSTAGMNRLKISRDAVCLWWEKAWISKYF